MSQTHIPLFRATNFLQIWKLLLYNYFANKFNLFNDFFLPLILIAILVSSVGTQSDSVLIDFYPGLIATPVLSVGFISFPACYVQWKNSGLFKRLKMCGFNPLLVSCLFGIFYWVIATIAVCLTIFYCWFFDKFVAKPLATQSFVYYMRNAHLGWFIFGLVQLQVVLFAGAFLIASFFKNDKNILGLGLILLLLHSFMLGAYLPMRFTLRSPVIRNMAIALPGYAPIRTIQASFLTIDAVVQAANPQVPYLNAAWDLTFLDQGEKSLKAFSFSNQYGWHLALASGWVLLFQTTLFLFERGKSD